MPTSYSGTTEDRLRRLDERGQRCDGNNRRCTQTAVVVFYLLHLDMATGEPVEGAEPIDEQACSKHRRAIGERAAWAVLDDQEIPSKGSRPKDRAAALAITARIRQLVGRTFTPAAGSPARIVTAARFVVDDYRLTDQDGQQHMLADVKLAEPAIAPVLFSSAGQ
jgi:hypothetical protein